MGFWNEYNPDFGIVFDEIDDAINAALNGTAGGGGAPPPSKPDATPKGQPNPPAGSAVRGPNNAIDPNGIWWNKGSDGSWTQGYPASAADRQAAGIGPRSGGTTGGTSTYNPNASTQARASTQQQNGGVMQPGANWVAYGANRYFDPGSKAIYQKDPNTGVIVPWGIPTSRAEQQLILNAMRDQRQNGAPNPVVNPGPGNVRTSTETPFTMNPVRADQAPILSSFSSFARPGEISADGRQTLYTGNSLNNLTVNPMGSGRNGPVVMGPAGHAPPNQGFGPGVSSNLHIFPGAGTSGQPSTVAANAYFPSTPFMVDKDYVKGSSGYNTSGYFQGQDIPFGVTPATATSPASYGTLSLTGPQNVQISNADKSVGMGFVTSPFAYNNIAAAYGRTFSDDAATRAVEAAMLMNAQQQAGNPAAALALLTQANPGVYNGQFGPGARQEGGGVRTDEGSTIFTGNDREDFGFGSYAKGGVVATGPSGRADQVTNEPMALVGLRSNRVKAIMGEDNADADRIPDPERLRFSGPNNSRLDITPLDPVRKYADGGHVQFRQQQEQAPPPTFPMFIPTPNLGSGGFSWGGYNFRAPEMGTVIPAPYNPPQGRLLGWYANGGTITTGKPTTPNPDPGYTTGPIGDTRQPTTTNPGYTTGPIEPIRTPTPDPGYTTNPGPDVRPTTPYVDPGYTTGPIINPVKTPPTYTDPGYTTNPTGDVFDPLDPNIINPWSAAAQANRQRDANIRRFGYRGDFAGLAAPIAVAVESGDVPAAPLGPGMYYDTTNQVNRAMSDIIGAQDSYRNLPPEIDTNPLYAREGEIGQSLDMFDRIRDLNLSRIAAQQGMGDVDALRSRYLELGNNIAWSINQGPTLFGGDLDKFNQYIESLKLDQATVSGQLNSAANAAQRVAEIDAQVADLTSKTAGLNEGSLQTERGLIRSQLQNNQDRINKEQELKLQIKNLAARGVPRVNAPIVPVAA